MFARAMGLTRALGRAVSLAAAGAAAGYLLRRRGLLGAQPAALETPTAPPPAAPPPEPPAVVEQETVEWTAAEMEEAVGEVVDPEVEDHDRADVTAVVDDLLGLHEGAVVDAEVVPAPDDTAVAEAVRVALAEEPGLLSSPIDIEVEAGYVTLRGELDRAEGIAAVQRKAFAVDGVRGVESHLQLARTAAPQDR
jgi:hypothetical protein